MDELPLDGSGVLYDVTSAGVTRRTIVASELGLTPAPLSALAGGSPAVNAALVEAVLGGKAGPHRDVVLLNAAAAFVAAGRADDLGDGITLAAQMIDTGAATRLLERLRAAKAARDAAKLEVATA
jgi:anthranilate phosphoribosyltransferase